MSLGDWVGCIIVAFIIGQSLCYCGANIGNSIKEGLHEIAHAMRSKEEIYEDDKAKGR